VGKLGEGREGEGDVAANPRPHATSITLPTHTTPPPLVAFSFLRTAPQYLHPGTHSLGHVTY